MKTKDIDAEILKLIQQKDMCIPRTTKIAKTLGVPPSTVHERLRKMRTDKVINGYVGLINGEKVDRGFVAFVLGQMQLPKLRDEKKYFENVGGLISKLPFVQEVYFIAGQWDIIAKMRVKDITDYYEKVKKIVEYFDVRGQGIITTHCFKDEPKVDLG